MPRAFPLKTCSCYVALAGVALFRAGWPRTRRPTCCCLPSTRIEKQCTTTSRPLYFFCESVCMWGWGGRRNPHVCRYTWRPEVNARCLLRSLSLAVCKRVCNLAFGLQIGESGYSQHLLRPSISPSRGCEQLGSCCPSFSNNGCSSPLRRESRKK